MHHSLGCNSVCSAMASHTANYVYLFVFRSPQQTYSLLNYFVFSLKYAVLLALTQRMKAGGPNAAHGLCYGRAIIENSLISARIFVNHWTPQPALPSPPSSPLIENKPTRFVLCPFLRRNADCFSPVQLVFFSPAPAHPHARK